MHLPHQLVFRSSPRLALLLCLLHFAALGSLCPLGISLWIKIPLAVALVSSLAMAVHRHALLLAAPSVHELVLKADGAVEGLRRDGKRFEATVSGQTAVLSGLVVMLLEIPGARRLQPLLVMPDSLPPEDGRKLRAWLRLKLS